MKNAVYLKFIMAVAVFGFACSGGNKPTVERAANNDGIINSNRAPDSPNTDDRQLNPRDRKNRANRVVNPSGTPETPEFRPAPEDSEAAVTMADDGSIMEIRVFKSHPRLEKVESTWVDPKEKKLKIFLKGGNVIELKTDRVASLQSTTTAELLEIASSKKKGDRPRIANPK
jgi:hypothetical protein